MRVDIQVLIKRLDDLSERLNKLLNKLEMFDDAGSEEITVEDVEQYFQSTDEFILPAAIAVLEQTEKLVQAVEIIKRKDVGIRVLLLSKNVEEYNCAILSKIRHLTQEEYVLLKEVCE